MNNSGIGGNQPPVDYFHSIIPDNSPPVSDKDKNKNTHELIVSSTKELAEQAKLARKFAPKEDGSGVKSADQALFVRAQFGKLSKDVSWLTKREAGPALGQIYDKQVRGQSLETYELIIAAAKHELNKSNLSLEDRVVLLDQIKTATESIQEISEIFYETHPKKDFTVDREGVQRVLLETRTMLEKNIVIVAKELKKNEAALLASGASLFTKNPELEKEIDQLQEQINSIKDELGHLPDEAINKRDSLENRLRGLQEKLDASKKKLEDEQARKLKDHEHLKMFKETLKGHAKAIIDQLNTVLKKIAINQGQIELDLKPDVFLEFVADQISDSVLKDQAENILGITKAYKDQHKEETDFKSDVVATTVGTIRDVIVAKGKNKLKALKKGGKKLVQIGALYGLYLLVNTLAPAIITKLGAILGGIGTIAGVANPVGAIIFGVIVAGVALYGIGLLIRRNKAHIIKVFTPLINAGQFIERKASRLFKSMKAKIVPDIHIPSDKRYIPTKDHQFIRELGRVVKQTILSHEEFKLKGEIKDLRVKLEKIVDQRLNSADEIAESLQAQNIKGKNGEKLETINKRIKNLGLADQIGEIRTNADYVKMIQTLNLNSDLDPSHPNYNSLIRNRELQKIKSTNKPESEYYQILRNLQEKESDLSLIQARKENQKILGQIATLSEEQEVIEISIESSNQEIAKLEARLNEIPADLRKARRTPGGDVKKKELVKEQKRLKAELDSKRADLQGQEAVLQEFIESLAKLKIRYKEINPEIVIASATPLPSELPEEPEKLDASITTPLQV